MFKVSKRDYSTPSNQIPVERYPVNGWCSLKGHTYLNKPAAERCMFV